MANHVADLLSRNDNLSEDRGQNPEISDPCRSVAKNCDRRRERFLTEEEFRRLGRVPEAVETCKRVSVYAAAIRLLLLTGCRKGGILNLRWSEVDLEAGELRLRDSKTGPRTITLSLEAAAVMSRITRLADNQMSRICYSSEKSSSPARPPAIPRPASHYEPWTGPARPPRVTTWLPLASPKFYVSCRISAPANRPTKPASAC